MNVTTNSVGETIKGYGNSITDEPNTKPVRLEMLTSVDKIIEHQTKAIGLYHQMKLALIQRALDNHDVKVYVQLNARNTAFGAKVVFLDSGDELLLSRDQFYRCKASRPYLTGSSFDDARVKQMWNTSKFKWKEIEL